MLTHYQMLEVSRSADLGAIKKAYYRISLLYHPDKTVHLPDAERTQREQLFKLANVAFEVLSDPQKRKAYDQTAPDFHWHYCQLNEYSKYTTLTYNNWLGWNFSIMVASHFKVVARPVIPQKPVSESIVVRLPLLRKGKHAPCSPHNIAIDLRGVPGNKHTILCSALVESQAAGLEVVVELAIAPETAQPIAQGPVSWKWAYSIDHRPLAVSTQARVTSTLFYPYKPFMAIAPRGSMPAPPYPEGSPMRGLLSQFPGIKIEEPESDSYCVREEQQGKTVWRLTAVGSM
ncbi:DnaJ-domain-containing protein [Didymella exigua CBS 183.55]|uniref:DnaJ-domain-containing protein n=1 Tax=Didymella exigua CBS 183.55 TaxID=1150837 RepID=A0A6A5RKT4_9PLEO|nr:DnaJ-domain-containing protein [Didymella exigua CBS 183.55]KAF1926157.1 DnaJ-domain-containing protein [Didymella exigua CBS 183.55]